MSFWPLYRDDIVFSFRKQKELAEKAFAQLAADDDFFNQPGTHSNSIAIIVKHLAGNLRSRWTDFLTTDGDKPGRDRDAEFIIEKIDTRASLMARWDEAWAIVFESLNGLQERDWLHIITIRGEKHTVLQAIHRSLTHAAYHVGQIVYVARLLKSDDWRWITIPPGESKTYEKKYLS